MPDCRAIQCQGDHAGVRGHVRERRRRLQSPDYVHEPSHVGNVYISTEFHRDQVRPIC